MIIALALITASGFAYLNRTYISLSDQKNNISVKLQWISYDSQHVAIEYDIHGVIHTSYGDFTDCPIGVSVVLSNTGKNVTGKTYTSCRYVSEGQYAVTQFFYNDFQSEMPQKVLIKIGEIAFSASNGEEEVFIPLLDTFTFDLPTQPSEDMISLPSQVIKAESGLDMFVTRANFTPRLVKVDTCMTLPDNGDWGIDAYVVMGDNALPITQWEIPDFRDPKVLENNKRCFTTSTSNVPDFRNMKPGEISFVVNKIYRNMPDCANTADFKKIKDELKTYGVKIEPDEAGYYCFSGPILDLNNSEANAHLFNYIQEALREEIQGPLEVQRPSACLPTGGPQ